MHAVRRAGISKIVVPAKAGTHPEEPAIEQGSPRCFSLREGRFAT
jgi:hypothetical protein